MVEASGSRSAAVLGDGRGHRRRDARAPDAALQRCSDRSPEPLVRSPPGCPARTAAAAAGSQARTCRPWRPRGKAVSSRLVPASGVLLLLLGLWVPKIRFRLQTNALGWRSVFGTQHGSVSGGDAVAASRGSPVESPPHPRLPSPLRPARDPQCAVLRSPRFLPSRTLRASVLLSRSANLPR